MDKELEEIVEHLRKRKDERIKVGDLYADGYEPYHRSMRKTIGNYQICFRETINSVFFEFGAIIKLPKEMQKDDKYQGRLFGDEQC